MAQIKPALTGRILCFLDEAEMEFWLSEKIDDSYIKLKCPICSLIYSIPIKHLGTRFKITAEILNSTSL